MSGVSSGVGVVTSPEGTGSVAEPVQATVENTAATVQNTAALSANTGASQQQAVSQSNVAEVLGMTENTLQFIFRMLASAVALCIVISVGALAFIAIRDGNTVEAVQAMNSIHGLADTLATWAIPTLGAVIIGKPVATAVLASKVGGQ